jgi:hypothetical protein
MHRDTLNAKYDADAQVKRLVWSMGKTFQKLSANKKFFHSFTWKNSDRKEDDIAIQTGIKSFVQCIKINAKTEEVDNLTTAMGWLVNNKGMVGTTLSIIKNKPVPMGAAMEMTYQTIRHKVMGGKRPMMGDMNAKVLITKMMVIVMTVMRFYK